MSKETNDVTVIAAFETTDGRRFHTRPEAERHATFLRLYDKLDEIWHRDISREELADWLLEEFPAIADIV